MFHFDSPENMWQPGVSHVSGGIEMEYWPKIGYHT